MREVAFEYRVCVRLERRPGVVARQLGASVGEAARRVVDVVRVEPGPAFERRADLTPAAIPPAVLDGDARVGEWRRVTAAFDGPPARAREVAERGVEVGVLERRLRDGRDEVRRVARYPDWIGGLVGVENKPDLGRPGDLDLQLRKDTSLGLFDRVVLATASHVTGAHLDRFPDPVGVWRLRPGEGIEVIRGAEPLDRDGGGLQVVERHPGQTEIRPVDADQIARQRRRVAERAYGRGWRPDGFPACAECEVASVAGTPTPDCAWKDRLVDPDAECGPECPGHDPADPRYDADDLARERSRRTGWEKDPPGRRRRQAGLDDF
ncbi:MAG: DUF5787 family protein [Halobacteriaceae archaeon]